METTNKRKSPLWTLTMLASTAISMFTWAPQKTLAATTGTLVLNDFQVASAGTVTVPLQVTLAGGDIGGFSTTITYDPAVVNIAAGGDVVIDPAFVGGSSVVGAGTGTTTITGTGAAPGLVGTVTLANITFTGIGAAGATTTITVTADPGTFVDSSSALFTSDPAPITTNVSIIDTTPDAFIFNAVVGAPISTLQTSNTITVAGINSPTPISISGNAGQYSINGGAFTALPGTVNNGNTVAVQQISSASFSTLTTTTLDIGGVTANFDVTTQAIDTTPDAFTFVAQSNVPVNTVITSNTITVAGINSPAAISIAGNGGEYSINGGAFVSAPGTVDNGNTVAVRQTSSASNSTLTTTTLTIGGVSSNFNVTTLAPGNAAPVLDSIDTQNAVVNTAFTFTANATDPNGDTLTFSLGSNAPSDAAINSSTGVFTWTPTTSGIFTFDVIVSDGSLTDTQSVTVNVTATATPQVSVRQGDNDSRCNSFDCKKFREYRSRYKNETAKAIYFEVKALKVSNPAEFQRLENIYLTYKSLSSQQRSTQLSPKVLADFFKFKNYNGYKHYRSLKDKV